MSGQRAISQQPVVSPAEGDALQREIDSAAQRLETSAPEEILAWAAERFRGKLTMATAFGPEGCVMIDMIARQKLEVDLFTLDTELFFPETYALWKTIEQRYGLRVRAVKGLPLEEQERCHGATLWRRDPSHCCQLRKVKPLREALASFDAWLTGIRREQTAIRGAAKVIQLDRAYGLYKINPMLNLSEDDVWRYVQTHDVPTNPLHAQGYASIGCEPCTTPVVAGETGREGRWRGQGKTECGIHLSQETDAVGRDPRSTR